MKISRLFWLLVVLGVSLGLYKLALRGSIQLVNWNQQLIDHAKVPVMLGKHLLVIEIVNKPDSITQGLSGRTELGSDGMLFILPTNEIPRFWMKDMLFDLDFVWLEQNKVVDLTPNAHHPQPDTPDYQLRVYSPNQTANQVLELPAGQIAKLPIQVGDQLEFK